MTDDNNSNDQSLLSSVRSSVSSLKSSTVGVTRGESSIGFMIIATLSEAIGVSNVLLFLLAGSPPLLFVIAVDQRWWLFWGVNLVFVFLILSTIEYLFSRSMYH